MHSDLSWRWLHFPDFLSQCRIRQAFLQSLRQLSERTWKASQKQRCNGKQAARQHASNIGPCFAVFKEVDDSPRGTNQTLETMPVPGKRGSRTSGSTSPVRRLIRS